MDIQIYINADGKKHILIDQGMTSQRLIGLEEFMSAVEVLNQFPASYDSRNISARARYRGSSSTPELEFGYSNSLTEQFDVKLHTPSWDVVNWGLSAVVKRAKEKLGIE